MTTYAATLDHYPLFIKAGAIIPLDVKTAVTGHGDTTSAGKTTVLKSIMGLVKQRRGSIRVGGEDVSALPAHRIARGLAATALRRYPPSSC